MKNACNRNLLTLFVIFIQALSFCFSAAAQEKLEPIHNEKPFSEWLDELCDEAESQGISKQTLDKAFAEIELVPKVIKLDRKQPEGSITLDEYLAKTVTASRINNGKYELRENRALLEDVAAKYSVPATVIVALWGMETSYGENTGSFNTIYSLATLAYDGRRSSFFRKELINSLKIMDEEKIAVDDFSGSWAGAFGQCQFMPSSFLKYAVDFDGDGKRDIWYSQADIFASIANYLHSEGWRSDENIEEGNNNFKVLLKWNRSRYFATAIAKLVEALEE